MLRDRWMRPFLLCIVCGLFAACGDIDETTSSAMDDDRVLSEEEEAWPHPSPDPGVRYFPAPTLGYLDGFSGVEAVHPEAKNRKPMILRDNVYWLPAKNAKTIEYYSTERIEFPSEGNEMMLGYQAGDILLS